MGSVGTWVFPVMWTLFCMFCMAMLLEQDTTKTGWELLIAEKRNENRVAWCMLWSALGWLVWMVAVYWRTRGGC